MSRATLYQADYRDTLHTVRTSGGADLVCTSPPYCDARTYGEGVSWAFEDYQELGDHLFQALKLGGHCLLNVDAPVREWRPGFGTERGFHPWKILLDWAERVGFRVPDRLAFVRLGVPGAYKGRFRNDWEPLIWFQRPGHEGYFDKHAIAVEAAHNVTGMAGNRKGDGTLSFRDPSGWAIENKMRHQGTAWDYGAVGRLHSGAVDVEDAGHPARFPFRLASDIIQCFSPPGGIVCDPFLGAGTTMIAALQHGRDFVGGDLYGRADGMSWVEVAADIARERYSAGPAAMFGLEDSHEVVVERPDSQGRG
jgi:DNA modification methylase